MNRKSRQIRALAPLALLSACAPTVTQAPVTAAARPPAYPVAGLESVIGRTAPALITRFGTPDLDIREGTARRLQFSNEVCVLDAYLYPPSGSAEAVVTHVDARLPDGRDLDRASCVASLGR